jgi:hypothetical protein
MRIFNEEVFNCGQCPLAIRDEYYVGCQKLDKEFYSFDTINKDCPFNKPITKEVIEGFGFASNHVTRNNAMYNIFKNEYSTFLYCGENNYFEISNCHDVKMTNNSRVGWIFKGVINNPIELEFILRSIGVIE